MWTKEITKQQFAEHDLFNKVFNNYIIKAITRNPEESNLYKKILGKVHRTLHKGTTRKRFIFGSFLPELNYRHIVFIPQEQAHLF